MNIVQIMCHNCGENYRHLVGCHLIDKQGKRFIFCLQCMAEIDLSEVELMEG